MDGCYKAFAEMLRRDGFVVDGFDELFTRDALSDCELLVVANALAGVNENDLSYPHPSAFTRAEIRATMEWVRGAVREWDAGRVVFLGEAALRSAPRAFNLWTRWGASRAITSSGLPGGLNSAVSVLDAHDVIQV